MLFCYPGLGLLPIEQGLSVEQVPHSGSAPVHWLCSRRWVTPRSAVRAKFSTLKLKHISRKCLPEAKALWFHPSSTVKALPSVYCSILNSHHQLYDLFHPCALILRKVPTTRAAEYCACKFPLSWIFVALETCSCYVLNSLQSVVTHV